MRKIIFLLFFILVPFVLADYAKTETSTSLDINDTFSVWGKTLTVLSADISGKLKVSVDGVKGIVRPGVNKSTNINEMHVEILNFTYVDTENVEVILKAIVNLECGDGFCNDTETIVSCCTDCGCEGNIKCFDNICQEEECVIDSDCDDNNLCTVDKCSTTPPRTCSNTLITNCVNNDSCCPDACGPVNDTDCGEIEEIIKPVEEEKIDVVPNVEEVAETIKKDVQEIEGEKKGIFILIGTALLVLIIGYFVIIKK